MKSNDLPRRDHHTTHCQNLLKAEIRWMAENAPHLDFTLALKRAEAGAKGSASPDLHLEQMEAK